MDFFSVNTIAFNIFGYPLSYLELVGTIFYLASVLLIAWRNIWTWLIGIISVILYMLLFYQIQLYADTIEQLYYLFASLYGWWYWLQSREKEKTNTLIDVSYSSPRMIGIWLLVTLIGSVFMGLFVSRAHEILPFFFTIPADYPWLDALTTVMSFVAMWLMARKRVESWVYWIIVDVIGIWLYFAKDVRFLSLLYVILLVMAINGLLVWHRNQQKQKIA